jgi:Uma2 family endonuclease
MSVVTRRPSVDRVIIRDVSWGTYQSLLNDLANRRSPRLAYDQGVLEIMSPHSDHEETNWMLASIVQIVLEESDLDFRAVASTTYKREDLERGFQSDSSFYIQSAGRVRNKKRINMRVDPPPDLLIEIDLTHDSLNKFELYAALGVPEVWRYEHVLEISTLDQGGYVRTAASRALPLLTDKIVSDLMEGSFEQRRPSWLRQIRTRIRQLIDAHTV